MTTPPTRPPGWAEFARQVIECAVRESPTDQIQPPTSKPVPHGGVFVTLHAHGRLRGCMGTLDPNTPLEEAVCYAATCAALRDPRFPPVTPDDLPDLKINVSIMSTPWPMRNIDELELGRHGIIVQQGTQRGLFLPQVAIDHRMDKETFLSRCSSEKAGLPPDAWRHPNTEILLFTAQVIHER